MLENVQPNWAETDPTKDSYVIGKPSLAAVATTGAYSDLSGKPVLDNLATDLRKTPLCVTIADSTTYNGVRWHRYAPTSGSHSGVYYDFNIEYSTDLVTWTAMTWTNDLTNTLYIGTHADSIGNKVYFRGENLFIYSSSAQLGWLNFQCTETATAANAVDLSGNLYSIVWKTDFANRTSLAPRATGYPNISFMRLFYNYSTGYQCNIRHAKDLQLPAPTLVASAYGYMFGYNANLLSAPELPATTLATACYSSMFINCTSLVQAPSVLPAETLVSTSSTTSGSYSAMFSGCTSLVKAPKILATTLTTYSAYRMFYGCTSLKEVETIFTSWGTNATSSWLPPNSTVAGKIFRCYSVLPMTTRDADHVPSTWSVVYSEVWKSELDKLDPTEYFAITALENGSLTLSPASGVTIEYKIPEASYWGTYSSSSPVNLIAGNTYYFRNTSTTAVAVSNGSTGVIYASAKFKVSGDVTTLLCKAGGVVTPPESAFAKLFSGTTNLVDASDLKMPSGTSASCYSQMFYGCTSLTGAPELPATTMTADCYYQMFYGCTSLSTPPALPATTLNSECYKEMFYGCTSLQSAPALPATTLASACYYGMFSGCSSLLACPDLPATTLESNCYREMFANCASLIRVPATLPAATLTGGCYYSMFNGCSALQKVPYNFLTSATSLAEACYCRMFQYCSNLTEAPNLKNLPLYQHCYYFMFAFCRMLRRIPALTATEIGGTGATITTTSYGAGTCVMMYKASFPVGYEPLNGDAQNGKYIYIVPEGTTLSNVPANVTVIVGDGNLKNRMTYDWQDVTNLVAHSDATVYGVTPNGIVGHITVASGLTLHATSSPYLSSSTGTVDYAELIIDLAVGATVTAGANITFADSFTAGKRNLCVVRFTNDGGTLYVTALEDLPASE